ncbi:NADH-quinone oxidoreductase subunit C [Flavobacterium sp. CYK-4]|uniref:NADH-quinone oxidoreductase subunit C n=1 Tax=Flavobacterium lotistagni TaxID=2709660 RepID=UPI0014083726|nr:NADH-quinone oxidoreductase subunit C [Flavobacterium lotistagni]NHM06633.1 NADH-quinone oxidoreductase subunit C [Flavobacterium lotistagni]
MALENNEIQNKLTQTFGDKVRNFHQERDLFSFEMDAEINTAVILFLKNDDALRFNFLTSLFTIHFPDDPDVNRQFAVTYLMHNWYENKRIRIRTFISSEKPEIKTISNIFPAANWMERESYDFFGVDFKGHQQLKRILNMDEMISHPMRKEFPMEDSGRTDKDDRFFGRTTINL